MRFTKIDGKTFEEISHKEMMNFFIERCFFAFMADGRKGFEIEASNIIDNVIEYYTAHDKQQKSKLVISNEQYTAMKNEIVKLLIDGFIKSGTAGLELAIMNSFNCVYLMMPSMEKK